MRDLRFDGRTVVVTGAGRGLGRSYAHLLAARGAHVLVNDVGSSVDGAGRDSAPALEVAEEICSAGGSAVANTADISTADGAEALVAATLAEFGRVDVVINNAGIIRWNTFPLADQAEMERHLAVHVVGTFNVSRAAWPVFLERSYGRIVNTISPAAFGLSSLLSYGASKGGILGLSRALADHGQPYNIKVNMISPTASTRMAVMPSASQSGEERTLGELPPERVASVVSYLAHEECPVTGEMYVAAGGGVARMFLAQTDGYYQSDLAPEDVRANWSRINDVGVYGIPVSTLDAAAMFHASTDAAGANSR